MTAFEKIKKLVAAKEADAQAFHVKGNKTAGTRLRKSYQELKTLAQEGRKEVITARQERAK